MSILADIADAVVAELDLGEFSRAFSPARGYDTRLVLRDLGSASPETIVRVVPGESTIEDDSRGDQLNAVSVDVGVFYKFGQSELGDDGRPGNAAVDGLTDLVEEIQSYLAHPERFRLTGYEDATRRSVEITAPFVPEHLEELHQFTGILRATYEVPVEY